MSANSQSLEIGSSITPDDSRIDTPEKRLLFQSLTQKLLSHVSEINFNTRHNVIMHINSHKINEISVEVYWYVDGKNDKQEKPATDYHAGYYWLSSEKISKWFRDVHIGLDLLVAENKAA
ncbi:hypothetical protein [Vibrio europaeus]|uniref:hypothetical protein n=1 Tax=Vibrio europaeus TaxID=300876 RepID=UPI00233F1683|nr:hypothetical protein [Vibrio europaeus]MDC5718868.1 hypothetical protein [Vibrio europaeus]